MAKKEKKPFFIQLDSLKDLARLSCALEKVPLPIFHLTHDGKQRLITPFGDFDGRPIFYFIETKEKSEYLSFRNNSGVEEVTFTDNAKVPGYTYSPIITIAKLPKVFEEALRLQPKVSKKFTNMQLEDLTSLVKICAYRLLFEEPPLPIFTFKIKDKPLVGAFSRIDEFEDSELSHLFFYLPVEDFPQNPYIRYDPGKGEIKFTSRIDEPGYICIKIIKLYGSHSLVDI
ncbi:MAG: hypothetical protein QXX95_05385 [Nitrososphaerales archaeon]